MAYSTDENLEQYVPDILDHGVPGLVENGVSTTLSAAAQAGGGSVTVADPTGLQAGDYIKIGSRSNVEVTQIDSIAVNTLTLEATTPLRKNHNSGVKIIQVDLPGFAADHDEAKDDIDRIIELKWFRPLARERIGKNIDIMTGDIDFDPALMLNAQTQLKKASCLRVLGTYVFPKLSKATRNADAWEKRADEFSARFDEEMERLVSVGIEYDWDASGQVDNDEDRIPSTTFITGRA